MQSSKRSRRSAYLLALLVVIVVACGGSGSGKSGNFESVSLTQTGGVAGLNRTVTLKSNGDLSTGKKVDDKELRTLKRLIAEAQQGEIKPTYVPEGLCCDQFHYSLAIDLGSKTITTETADGAAGPKVIEDIIGTLIVRLPTS